MSKDRPFEKGPQDETLPELDELWRDSAVDSDRVWARLEGGLAEAARVPLALRPRRRLPLRAAASSVRRVAAVAVGTMVAVGLLAGLLIGISGSADASFLDEVIDLSEQTDAALADGELTAEELDALTEAISALTARLEAGEDLAELDVAEFDAALGRLAAVRGDLVVAAAVNGLPLNATDGESPVAELGSLSANVLRQRRAFFKGSVLVALSSHASATALEQVVSLADLPLSVVAHVAGSVEISAADGELSVSRVSAAEGWEAQITTPSGQQVVVTFSDGQTTVQVKASLNGDEVVIEMESEEDGDGSDDAGDGGDNGDDVEAGDDAGVDGGAVVESFVVGTAGIVVLEYTDRVVLVLSAEPDEGWEVVTERVAGRSVRVEFENEDGERSRLKAELANGELKIKIDLIGVDDAAEEEDDDADGDDAVADEDNADPREVFEIDGRLELTFQLVGGEVTIIATETTIILLHGAPADGWELDVQRIVGREARVEFDRAGERSRLAAQLVGGGLRVRITLVETDGAGDGNDVDGQGAGSGPPRSESVIVEDAGIVTVRHTGRRILSVMVYEEEGWESEVEQSATAVDVRFERDGTLIALHLALRDGVLERVEAGDVDDDESGGRGRGGRPDSDDTDDRRGNRGGNGADGDDADVEEEDEEEDEGDD